jgi:hypothetical protein
LQLAMPSVDLVVISGSEYPQLPVNPRRSPALSDNRQKRALKRPFKALLTRFNNLTGQIWLYSVV